jgi:hypothetical protein
LFQESADIVFVLLCQYGLGWLKSTPPFYNWYAPNACGIGVNAGYWLDTSFNLRWYASVGAGDWDGTFCSPDYFFGRSSPGSDACTLSGPLATFSAQEVDSIVRSAPVGLFSLYPPPTLTHCGVTVAVSHPLMNPLP